MSADWLDRVARAADERVSRRRLLQQTGLTALTLGPLATLLRTGPAQAAAANGFSALSEADDCLPQCLQHALDEARAGNRRCLPVAAYGGAISGVLFVSGFGCLLLGSGSLFAQSDRCLKPNCGKDEPPPKPPWPPPEPLPPDLSQLPPPPTKKKPSKKKPKSKKSTTGGGGGGGGGVECTLPGGCNCGPFHIREGDVCCGCSATTAGVIPCPGYLVKNGKCPCCPGA
jgi:hypothetical protein